MFKVYLELGFKHILDLDAYDHILFVVVLCAVYAWKDWRRLLFLVTAFTIGHSITLALSALGIVVFSPELIEFLIPLTIFATAISNITLDHDTSKVIRLNYMLALFFGCIHGLGFSNYLKALLGDEESIVPPLLSFNLGVELGQLIIVALIFLANYVVTRYLGASQRSWTIFMSGAAAGIAVILMRGAVFW